MQEIGGTRERILQESLRLFAQDGYEAVSVRDIAARLGVTQSALYKHYAGKRDIFEQIVRRMEADDLARAKAFAMPEGTRGERAEAYRLTTVRELKRFSMAQFRYWTEDGFAADFRRMLTLEQYRTPEMAALYRQYLSDGPVCYLADLFSEMPRGAAEVARTPRQLAVAFYAPLYLLMSLSDAAESRAEAAALAKAHIDRFFEAPEYDR